MAKSDDMGNTPSDDWIEGMNSEKTRLCFEYLGWSTTQWMDPSAILEIREEQTIELKAELELIYKLTELTK